MELEERAADPLAGGLMLGCQCGMLWGAALAGGAQAYRSFGPGPQAETATLAAAGRIVDSFRARNRHVDCRDITGIDLASPRPGLIALFLIKSAPTGSCLGMSARCARASLREIEA